jgi:trk system potassium uptake protein TrkH
MIPCFVLAIIEDEKAKLPFLISLLIIGIISLPLIFFNRNYPRVLTKKDGKLFVGFLWIIIPIFGATPYMFSQNVFPFIIDALFESFSGFTTTGSTIINDIDSLDKSLLLWRGITQWIGGLGIILFVILLIRNFHNGSNYLFNAEFTSIDKEKIQPHIKDTVYRILYIYIFITLLSILLLSFGDMNVFSSILYSFSTVSTGGFTANNAGLSSFSAYSQYVITLIMILSGLSYALLYWAYKGKWRKLFEDEQTKYYFLIILFASVGLFVALHFSKQYSIMESVRIAIFNITSIVTTTGYFLPQIKDISQIIIFIMIVLMFIGGCSGSSSTGLKIVRVIILFKYFNNSFKRIFHPRAVIPIRYNKNVLVDDAIGIVFGFFFLYLIIFVVGAFLLTLFGSNFFDAISISAANISNTGSFIPYLEPEEQYASMSFGAKTTIILLMIVGRLEIYSLLAIFSKTIWRRS